MSFGEAGPRLIDCHLHAWNRRDLSYPWMESTGLPTVSRVPDRHALDAASTRGVLLVEAGVDAAHRQDETEWMLAHVGTDVLGVIAAAGWEDVSVPDAQSGLVGVRINILGAARERDAVQRIAETCTAAASAGLPVDVLCSPHEFDLVVRSLELMDDVVLVIDHLGRPPVEEGWYSEAASAWYRSVEVLSRHAGVRVKISGLPANSTEFVSAAIGLLGTDRCLLGSDWPMNRSGSYPERMHAVVSAAASHVDTALAASTAMSVYSLSQHTTRVMG